MAPRYSQKRFFFRPPSWICKISIFWQVLDLGIEICICLPNFIWIWSWEAKEDVVRMCEKWYDYMQPGWCQPVRQETGIHGERVWGFARCCLPRSPGQPQHLKYQNRIWWWWNHGWDIEIKLFSKWRPSAILSLRKLQFWSLDLYLHVILHLCSKFRFNRPIWRRDIAKNVFFQYGIRPPSWICKIWIFFTNTLPGNWNLHLLAKFYLNRIILGWDIEIKLFSKWRHHQYGAEI